VLRAAPKGGPMTRALARPGRPSLARRVVAEGVGTAFLLATIVGSGIMAERLAGGNGALALLANTLATGGGLLALILAFGGISGAHFNPAVTVAVASQGELAWRDVTPYILAQIFGAFMGVALAHLMFDLPIFSASRHLRSGTGQLAGELTATFGLVSVIRGCSRSRAATTPFAVAVYIVAAYWFTSSTSFANPAVTLARAASDTFAGIRPADVPGFVVAQALGATGATLLFRWLLPAAPAAAEVTPGDQERAA
jgi:glycerol uptake facilitator-like aquaporin